MIPNPARKGIALKSSGHPGIWPGGEPESVRAAYDRWLASQQKPKTEPRPPVRVPARPGVKPR